MDLMPTANQERNRDGRGKTLVDSWLETGACDAGSGALALFEVEASASGEVLDEAFDAAVSAVEVLIAIGVVFD